MVRRRRSKRKVLTRRYPTDSFPYKSEAHFQMACAAWIRENIRDDVRWTAFPAGGGGRNRGAMLKMMGLQPGWPDLIFLKDGRFFGIELKTPSGVLSPAQKEFQAARASAGRCLCARSLEEVRSLLGKWELSKGIRLGVIEQNTWGAF